MIHDHKTTIHTYIQKYSQDEEIREKAIQGTISFCTKLIALMAEEELNTDELLHDVIGAWELHLSRKVDQKELASWTFGYTPDIIIEVESLGTQAYKNHVQSLEEEEKRLVEKWGLISLYTKFLATDNLNWLEKMVLELRLGLTNGYIYTQQEIGQIVGATGWRIYHIENEAFSKVKKHLE